MQQDQHAGRPAQVVHPRHRLLTAVTALVEVDRASPGADPADLVGDRPLVGVHAESGPLRGHPVGLVGPDARAAYAGGGRAGPATAPCPARGTSRSSSTWPSAVGHPAHEPATGQRRGRRLARAARRGRARRAPPDRSARGPSSDSTARSAAAGCTSDQNTIFVQVGQQRLTAPRFGVQIGDAAELGLQPVILDPALAVEAEVLGAGAVGERRRRAGWRSSAASCRSVGSGQRDDGPMRAVHHHRIVLGGALLAERVAVVPHRSGVGGGIGCGYG